ncbi:hypothetical protein [Streptomyces sp. NPDC003379]
MTFSSTAPQGGWHNQRPVLTTMASWHFYKAYWTANECHNKGRSLGGTYKCTSGIGHDGECKWFLYRWY